MPHLQFDINKEVLDHEKKKFINQVKHQFSDIMKTGSDHVAISLRELTNNSLHIGRANFGEYVCLMNLDIRSGRSSKQKRSLVNSYISLVNKFFDIKRENQYVTITEHKGDDFNLDERSLSSWSEGDDPLKEN